MEVILLQRVEKLGRLGECVTVRPGYARNFLLPKKIALRATKENIAHFEKERNNLETLNITHKKDAEILAKKLEGTTLVILRQASEGGQLYGSVSAKDIAKTLNQKNITKSNISIHSPMKTLGIHAVRVHLHPEVDTTICINIAKTKEEAKAQAEAAKKALASSTAERIES